MVSAELSGKVLAGYRLQQCLGVGALGAVYQAEREGHTYALKLIHCPRGWGVADRQRLAALQAVKHPNLAPIIDLGLSEPFAYVVTTLVTGPQGTPRTLADELRAAPADRIPPRKLAAWLDQLGRALGAVHAAGAAHQDIKPSNVLLDERGRVVLTDWFAVTALGADQWRDKVKDACDATEKRRILREFGGDQQTAAEDPAVRSLLTAFAYQAPEQHQGAPGDARSDIYSLGYLAYRLLIGRPPVGAADAPSAALPTVGRHWDVLVRRCLALSPEQRYGTAEQFVKQVRRCQPWRRLARKTIAAAAIIAVVAGVAFVPGLLQRQWQRGQQRQAAQALWQQAEAAWVEQRGVIPAPGLQNLLAQGETLYEAAQHRRADPAAVQELLEHAAIVTEAVVARDKALAAQQASAATRAQAAEATLTDAQQRLWDEAERLAADAEEALQSGDFATARHNWRDARERYREVGAARALAAAQSRAQSRREALVAADLPTDARLAEMMAAADALWTAAAQARMTGDAVEALDAWEAVDAHYDALDRRRQLSRAVDGYSGAAVVDDEQGAAWLADLADDDEPVAMVLRDSAARRTNADAPVATTAATLAELAEQATQGDGKAYYALGQAYEHGLAVPPDASEAARQYSRAVDLDEPAAMAALAELFADGRGVAASPQRAQHWRREAAQRGHVAAMMALADALATGPEADLAGARQWRLTAAQAGDPEAMYQAAHMLDTGQGGPLDAEQAQRLRADAAVQGHSAALAELLAALEQQVAQDELTAPVAQEARAWLPTAAADGHPTAMRLLAQSYEQGLGLPADSEQAHEWYLRAAQAGDAPAALALGQLYADGYEDHGPADAAEWYAQAARAGLDEAALTLAHWGRGALLPTTTSAELLGWLESLASVGNVEAMRLLGDWYGDEEDESAWAAAARWYEQAASAGDPDALYRLGRMLYYGRGVPADAARGRELLRQAAAAGQPDALNDIGVMLLTGEGVSPDVRQGLVWLQRAASAGSATAQRWLGYARRQGLGGPPDATAALAWRRRAADAGDPEAMFILAGMLEQGEGAPADPAAARQWYQKAADAGHHEAHIRAQLLAGR